MADFSHVLCEPMNNTTTMATTTQRIGPPLRDYFAPTTNRTRQQDNEYTSLVNNMLKGLHLAITNAFDNWWNGVETQEKLLFGSYDTRQRQRDEQSPHNCGNDDDNEDHNGGNDDDEAHNTMRTQPQHRQQDDRHEGREESEHTPDGHETSDPDQTQRRRRRRHPDDGQTTTQRGRNKRDKRDADTTTPPGHKAHHCGGAVQEHGQATESDRERGNTTPAAATTTGRDAQEGEAEARPDQAAGDDR